MLFKNKIKVHLSHSILYFKMTTAIDFRTMPINVPSICIPRVFPNIDERRIRRVFDELNMGEIDRVDIVRKQTEKGENFNRVFVHFKRWASGGNADVARERLLNGKEIKIVYDDPWFWKVSASRATTSQHDKRPSAPRLQIDDDDRRPTQRDNRRRDDRRRNDRIRDDRRRDDRRPRNRSPSPRRTSRPLPVEPRTPSCSPPRERVTINYGDGELLPVKKPLNFKKKTIIKIDDEEPKQVQSQVHVEDGEVKS